MILMSYILQRRESSGFFFFRPDVSKFRKQIGLQFSRFFTHTMIFLHSLHQGAKL